MRKCYIISWDLNPDQTYSALTDRIKEYGTWARITESTWSVVTDKSSKEVRDSLTPFLSPNDRMFVVQSGSHAAWRNAIASSDWLKKYIKLP